MSETPLQQAIAGRRWAILAVAWAAFLMSFADRLAWGNVAAAARTSLALPLAALGAFVTAFYIGYVISNLVAGFAGDWLGPRRVLAGSLLCLGAATFAFGSTSSLAMGLALQALMGLTAGADYVAGVKLITAWFGRLQRGRAMGLFMTATSLAVVLTNLAVPRLMAATGWPGVYHVLGAMTAALGVIAFLVVADGPPGRQPAHAVPDFGALLRNGQLRWLGLAGFGALWGTWGFAFWASTLMVRGHGLAPVQAGLVVALFGAGAIVAKPAIGLASDLMGGRRRALVISCLLFFVAMLLLFSQLGSFAAFALAGPLLGVGAFAYSPLMNTMVAEASGAAMAASGAGATNAFWGLGNVIVPSLLTLSFASNGSFVLACLLLAAGPLFGAACMAFTRDLGRERAAALAEALR